MITIQNIAMIGLSEFIETTVQNMRLQHKVNVLCQRAKISKTDLANLFKVKTSTVVNMSDKNPKSHILLSSLILLQTYSGLTGNRFLQLIKNISFNDGSES